MTDFFHAVISRVTTPVVLLSDLTAASGIFYQWLEIHLLESGACEHKQTLSIKEDGQAIISPENETPLT